ncbi:hypothetical protein CHCC20490_0854 [Bacillus paralicheniformis]|nr:hypothetical protein CHCC20490_0854 [Bacillus paralicheniformis]
MHIYFRQWHIAVKFQYFIHQDALRNPVTDDVVEIYDQYMPNIFDFDQLGPHKRRPA